MIISGLAVGQELPTHAVKVLSKSKSASSSDYSTVIYADLTAAPVPRPIGTPFRHLSKLNLEIVTKEDLDQAAHACKTHGVDKLAGAQRGEKPKKLTGKAKMHNLEQSLNNIMLEQRELQVDRTLKKLMRYGTLDKFQPGLAGALAQRGAEEEEPKGTRFTCFTGTNVQILTQKAQTKARLTLTSSDAHHPRRSLQTSLQRMVRTWRTRRTRRFSTT
jgi:hypothetical protein